MRPTKRLSESKGAAPPSSRVEFLREEEFNALLAPVSILLCPLCRRPGVGKRPVCPWAPEKPFFLCTVW